jgi:transcriptional regulator with XRE-family HTH domain
MSLSEIGELMDLDKSFVSRVRNGKKNLTIERLKKLERALDFPLPLLLLEAVDQYSIPDGFKPHYEALRKVLIKSADLDKGE